jgi:hypothetical protein
MTEKFSYKNILIQHKQEELKKELIKMLNKYSFKNEIPGEFIYLLEVEGHNYYYTNHFCLVCGNFTRIGDEIYCDSIPSNISCVNVHHLHQSRQLDYLNQAKYYLKEYSKTMYVRETILGKHKFESLLGEYDWYRINTRYLCAFELTNRYSVEEYDRLQYLYVHIRKNLIDLKFYELELQKSYFKYHNKLFIIYPWIKEMVYSYLFLDTTDYLLDNLDNLDE